MDDYEYIPWDDPGPLVRGMDDHDGCVEEDPSCEYSEDADLEFLESRAELLGPDSYRYAAVLS